MLKHNFRRGLDSFLQTISQSFRQAHTHTQVIPTAKFTGQVQKSLLLILEQMGIPAKKKKEK